MSKKQTKGFASLKRLMLATACTTMLSSVSAQAGQLTIEANADVYNGAPIIQVMVNGTRVAATEVTAENDFGESQVFTAVIPDNVKMDDGNVLVITYENDLFNNFIIEDRNVYIRAVSIDGMPLMLENAVYTGGLRNEFDSEVATLFNNGTITIDVPSDMMEKMPEPEPVVEPRTMTIYASGDLYKGRPEMQIMVNGKLVDTVKVTAARGEDQPMAFNYTLEDAVVETVDIAYTNDVFAGVGMDRNLYINGLSVDGEMLNLRKEIMTGMNYMIDDEDNILFYSEGSIQIGVDDVSHDMDMDSDGESEASDDMMADPMAGQDSGESAASDSDMVPDNSVVIDLNDDFPSAPIAQRPPPSAVDNPAPEEPAPNFTDALTPEEQQTFLESIREIVTNVVTSILTALFGSGTDASMVPSSALATSPVGSPSTTLDTVPFDVPPELLNGMDAGLPEASMDEMSEDPDMAIRQ